MENPLFCKSEADKRNDTQGVLGIDVNYLEIGFDLNEAGPPVSKGMKRKSEDVSNFTSKKLRPSGFTDECYKETEYYMHNGLRKVYPYYYTYSTFCKGRWVGKQLLDVFSKEFRAHPKSEYERCIKAGSLTVNGKVINIDYKLRDCDFVTNKVHRHEVPILGVPLKIIHESDDILVIDKPPSIPVHPCGRYRHNSVVFILAKEYGLKELHTIHRLDRLTSGLLVFGKDKKRAQEMYGQIRERQVKKEYICRVEGNFPDESVTCEEPIEILSHKIGVCVVSPSGKDCKTEFTKLSFNGKSSLVKCKPLTGRMHQIRVHLQYLGYPILNDPLYNHEAFGPKKGKNGEIGKTKEKLLEDLLKIHTTENWLGIKSDEAECNDCELNKDSVDNYSVLSQYIDHVEYKKLEDQYKFEPDKIIKDQHCIDCYRKYRDPYPKDLLMYLHALSYKGENWEFCTEIPIWAKDNWKDL